MGRRRARRARRRNDMPVVRFPADISGDRAAAAAVQPVKI